jgi:hypothetical protein
MTEKLDVTVVEADSAQSWGDRCHDGRQLVIGQLSLLRLRAGAREGEAHETHRDLSQAGGEGIVSVASSDSYSGAVRLPGGIAKGAVHTVYTFDTRTEALHGQEFGHDTQPLGEAVQYRDDAAGDAVLSQLHTVLHRANFAPEVPAAA